MYHLPIKPPNGGKSHANIYHHHPYRHHPHDPAGAPGGDARPPPPGRELDRLSDGSRDLRPLRHGPVLHNLVLRSPVGAAIQQNILLYALYGGLAAGLFEETGRLLAFRFVLKTRTARLTALSYGIGHGGIEAFLVMGLSMIANLSLGLAYTSGAPLPAEAAAAAETILSTPAGMFLWGGLERLSAMALHMALSVLVFASVRTGRGRLLFPAAIAVHAGVNFAAVVANAHLPIAATEAVVLLLTALACLWAARIYKNLRENAKTS